MADRGSGAGRPVPERWKAVLIALLAPAAALVSYLAAVISGWWPAHSPESIAASPVSPVWAVLAVAGYGCALLSGSVLGSLVFFGSAARRVAQGAVGASVAVVVAHVGQLVAEASARHSGGDVAATVALAFASAKWALVFPTAVVAALGVGTTLHRASRRRVPTAPPVIRPAVDEDEGLRSDGPAGPHDQRAAWRANSTLPGRGQRGEEPAGSGPSTIGFCVSGGGIRAATFTFGALESLRDVLVRARWLVSVSGGGYATGAMRLALQRMEQHADRETPAVRRGGWRSVAQPGDVYRSGSSELDHTRRHGRYLTDGAGQWLTFAVTVARGFLVSLVTLGLAVVLVGRVLSHLYEWIAPGTLTTWPPQTPALWAVVVLVAVWLLLFTAAVMIEPAGQRVTRVLRSSGVTALAVAVLIALGSLGLPLLAWSITNPPQWVAWGSPTATVAGGYLAALIALGRQASTRAAVGKAVSRGRALWRGAGPGGRAVLATALVYAGLLVVLSGYLVLFAAVLANTGGLGDTAVWFGRVVPEWVLTVAVAAAVAVLAMVDQVRWSLHPYYRQRLAAAFAVRRVRDGGRVRAQPYDYDAETTFLHRYGTTVDGFPELIFSCAAHVSGQQVAPPGRRVMPWTFSATYIGGQAHGWVATGPLCRYVSPTLQHDLTVQGAQAVSGAALASQMGTAQRVYSKFLTLTNIRLGSWLPNPAYLHGLPDSSDPDAWAWPALPRRRRLTTLLREFVGAFPAEHPLVFLTDGGHYENLGLVELLRRRPSVVYCLDASDDRGHAPQALAQAVELAYEELGVTIDLPDAALLGAGPQQPDPDGPTDPLIAGLRGRLAHTCVVTGTVGYPDLGPGLPAATGRIIVGKAVITAESPFPLLAYASHHHAFPTDTVSDQWFDATQFDAYHSLGRHVGRAMLVQPVSPEAGGAADGDAGDEPVAAARDGS